MEIYSRPSECGGGQEPTRQSSKRVFLLLLSFLLSPSPPPRQWLAWETQRTRCAANIPHCFPAHPRVPPKCAPDSLPENRHVADTFVYHIVQDWSPVVLRKTAAPVKGKRFRFFIHRKWTTRFDLARSTTARLTHFSTTLYFFGQLSQQAAAVAEAGAARKPRRA